MIKSRRKDQFRIIQLILSDDDNPMTWNDEQLRLKCQNEVVIGFIYKTNDEKFGNKTDILNLYVIPKTVEEHILTLTDLQNGYAEWYLKRAAKPKAVCYHNPPIEDWLNTKKEWLNNKVNKFCKLFEKDYDDILSLSYIAILKCYKHNVYMGNLHYINLAIYHEICLELRTNKNKITGYSKNTISLDSIVDCDEGSPSVAATLGENDARYDEVDFEQIKLDILKTLHYTFSDREIDQIISSEGIAMRLPNTLYRRLLKWRETHKRSDFNV